MNLIDLVVTRAARSDHRTLRVTPAMEAGVTDHVWILAEVVSLLER
jgi:hypothetical protein